MKSLQRKLFHGVKVPDSPRGVNTRSRRFITIVENTPRSAHKVTGGKSMVRGLPPKNVGKGQGFALCS